MTAYDARGDITNNLERATHTSNGNETVTHTSSRNIEQKLLSNQTISVVYPTMKLRIEQSIAPIVLAPQTILTPATKEVVADAASCGVWVNMNPRQLSRGGVNRSTRGNISNDVSVKSDPFPFLIVILATPPTFSLNSSLQIANKQESTSPTLVGNTQKLDAVVDGKFPNDIDSVTNSLTVPVVTLNHAV